MLGKLIKYDMKSTARLLIPMYIILISISLINSVALYIDSSNKAIEIISAIFAVTYVLAIIATIFITVGTMILHYYKNLLTKEGYLMFTLPSKPGFIIVSKLLVTIFWVIISVATIIGTLLLILAASGNENWVLFLYSIRNGFRMLNEGIPGNKILFIAQLILLLFIRLIAFILSVYVSIAIGQMISKHKIIGSFLAYLVIYFIEQVVMLLVLVISIGFSNLGNPNISSSLPIKMLLIILVTLCIESIIYFSVTNHIFTKRLNLE